MNRVRLGLVVSVGALATSGVLAACSSSGDDGIVPVGSSSGAAGSSGAPSPSDGGGSSGSGDGGTGLAPLSPAMTEACTDLFEALVANVGRCAELDSPYVETNRASYLTACTTQMRLPGTTADLPTTAGECAIALATSACDQSDDVTCAAYYRHVGTLAVSATCESGAQCLSGSCITQTTIDDEQCGTCGAVANAGDACDTGATCAEGTRCMFGADGTGSCTVPTPAGSTCASGSECADGLDCVQGTCAPIPAVGQPCNEECTPATSVACLASVCTELPATEGAACVDGQCAAPLACSAAAGQCKTIVYTGDIGASCSDQFTQCKPGLYCAGEVPVCAAYGALGAACGTNDHDSRCIGFASCVAGTCQDYAPQCSY